MIARVEALEEVVGRVLHMLDGEDSVMSQHERHLAEANERGERHHRESDDRMNQMLMLLHEMAEEFMWRKQRDEKENNRIIQIVLGLHGVLGLRGDGTVWIVKAAGQPWEPYA